MNHTRSYLSSFLDLALFIPGAFKNFELFFKSSSGRPSFKSFVRISRDKTVSVFGRFMTSLLIFWSSSFVDFRVLLLESILSLRLNGVFCSSEQPSFKIFLTSSKNEIFMGSFLAGFVLVTLRILLEHQYESVLTLACSDIHIISKRQLRVIVPCK